MTSAEPPDLRHTQSADVYLGDEVCGRLRRTHEDTISFKYLPVKEVGGFRDRSVSWSLLRGEQYPAVSVGGSVPPFFAGLLPEGVRLGVVLASTKTSADDHFTLLLAIGSDTIGNVRVVPSGADLSNPLPLFDPERDDDFHAVYARLTGSVDADPVGIAGVQPKVSAATWSTPTRTTSGPAILKLGPAQYPQIVENEHFFMTMAAACGLSTAKTRLLHDAKGRSALLVSRFDRNGATRIPQEDACQVAGMYPASKYRMKAEDAVATLADSCARGGGSRITATFELLRVVVFSWLIGNGDLHGKNLSIYNPDGIWRPTPAYDLLTTQPYAGWRDPMALNLYGRANKLTRANFVDAGERLGLGSKAVERMTDQLIEAASPWAERCGEIGFDGRQTDLLSELIRGRIDSLKV